jgi:SHS2 domain-containing protein
MFEGMRRYELLDHTADIGIVAFGGDLPEAFGNAAYAMFDILTDTDKIRDMDRFDLRVSASNIEELLVTWLDELLYRYETERLICKRFVIDDMDDVSLRATVFGEKLDPTRHEVKLEIKSVTYHQLKVEKTDDGWRAQVIFDV